MKRYSLICHLAVLLMPLALVSCSEDDNTVEEFLADMDGRSFYDIALGKLAAT